MPIVEARALRREYRTVKRQPGLGPAFRALFRPEYTIKEAVKGIDLSIEAGEVVAFLGPNGAGKTTTLKMLAGILPPSSGECRVLGAVPFERRPEILKRIALVMGNKQQLWWDLPARDSFGLLKEIYEVPEATYRERLDTLVDRLALGEHIDRPVRKLSLGERMKCELVAALIHSPDVVFLDEPTIGLDVIAQLRIREFLREDQARQGSTILLTSHTMQDVTELCHRVVVIDHGAIIFDGSLDSLSARYGRDRVVRLRFSRPVAEADLVKFGEVSEHTGDTSSVSVTGDNVASAAGAMLRELPVADVAIEEPPMEEIIRRMFAESSAQRAVEVAG